MRPHRLTHVSRGSRENTPSLMTVSAWRSGARKASSHLMREAIRGALIGNQRHRWREEGVVPPVGLELGRERDALHTSIVR